MIKFTSYSSMALAGEKITAFFMPINITHYILLILHVTGCKNSTLIHIQLFQVRLSFQKRKLWTMSAQGMMDYDLFWP